MVAGFGVVAVVAALAQRGEVEEAGGLRAVVVDVGCGQDYFAASERVRAAVAAPAPFAAITGAVKAHEARPKSPVFRVAGFIFGEDRHGFRGKVGGAASGRGGRGKGGCSGG